MNTEHAVRLAIFGWELLVHRKAVLGVTVDEATSGTALSRRSLLRLEGNRHLITYLATLDGYEYLSEKLAGYRKALPSPADGTTKPPADPVRAIATLSMPTVSTLSRIDDAYQLPAGTANTALHTSGSLRPAETVAGASFSAADLARHVDFAAALAEKAHINIGGVAAGPGITVNAARSHALPGGGIEIVLTAAELERLAAALNDSRRSDS